MKYEVFEHTADIGIHIFGHTFNEIFNNSVSSFADLIMDSSELREDTKKEVSMGSTSPEYLLVDLLSLLLYEFEANSIIYFESNLQYSQDEVTLSGTLAGCNPGSDIDYRNVIKAVTYHGVEISPEKGYASVVFDI